MTAWVEIPSWADISLWGWIGLLIAALGEVLSVWFVLRVLTRGGSPSSTLLWMVAILVAPWIGLGLYYLLPRRIHLRRLRRRATQLEWIEASLADAFEPPPPRAADPSPSADAVEPLRRLLIRLDQDAVQDGCSLALIQSGEEFFEQVHAALAAARHYVHFQTYIFRPDASGLRLLEALTATARRGVEVRLLYDSFGSWGLKRRHLEPLADAGGHTAAFLPLFWRRRPFTLNFRNHRKLVVVDGETAWLGGRNVGDEYAKDKFGRKARKWLDAMVRIEGAVVPRLHRVFLGDWYNATEEDLARPPYCEPTAAVGDVSVGVVDGGPDRRTHDMQWTLFEMIGGAQSSIDISTPYLIPPPALILALQVAATRGVRVRIHTNGRESEHFVLYQAQRGHYSPLLEAGVEIYETTGDYNHAKVVVIDERVTFVGSANWDMRSALLNFEIGAVAWDAGFARATTDLLEGRARSARRFAAADLPTGLVSSSIQGACRLLSPLL